MTSSNYIRVGIVPEDTFGTVPSNPQFLILPTTGQSMRDRIGYQTSQTLRPDRNVKDLIRLTKSSGGGLPCEVTYSTMSEAFGQAIRAVLCSSGEDAAISVANCTVSSAGDTVTRPSGDWTASDAVVVGDVVKVTGTASATTDGYYKVTAVSTTVLTLENVNDGDGWTGNDTSVTVVRGARMTNGTTERSFSVEVARTDINKAQVFTGQVYDSMTLSVADESITTATFSLQGASSTLIGAPDSGTGTAALYFSGASYTDPTENPVMESLSVPEFQVGGASYGVKSFSISMANNASPRTQIGTLGPQSIRLGSFSATGSFQVYLDSFVDFVDFQNNLETDFWFVLEDANGRAWSFSFPAVKFSDVGADTGGMNQEDFENGSITAYLDSAQGCTVRVQRWA